MKTLSSLLAVAAALALSTSASAHKPFLVPSSTVLSGVDEWITVDAAVSDDLFYFNHQPLNLDGLAIAAPDGSPIAPENATKGKVRNTFDVHLVSRGTYRIGTDASVVFANYELDGEKKRWRGTPAAFRTGLPAGAQNVEVSEGSNRVETWVTAGQPTTRFSTSGVGLALQPVTHPNDLIAGHAATFRMLLDGRPAANLKVIAVPGDSRYRDHQDEIETTTDADGRFSFKWPAAGLWWINAAVRDAHVTLPQAKERRASYAATLEVMPD